MSNSECGEPIMKKTMQERRACFNKLKLLRHGGEEFITSHGLFVR